MTNTDASAMAERREACVNDRRILWRTRGRIAQLLALKVVGFTLRLAGFFFQAEDGIRDGHVTGVQMCALPIFIVLIDYLTLIQSHEKYHSDHAMYSAISKRLKAISQEYDCPVVTLAQLNRSLEQRNDKRPMLSDLRESGSIEEDADGIMFLYRDSYYNREEDDNILEINLAKHRDGSTGTVKDYYNKVNGKIGDLSDDQRAF